jgi:DNA-binding NtrC family response regulator
MQKTKPLILTAEDDTQLAEVLNKQLSLSGLNVQTFQNGTDAM